jgi:23S rRNA U2552 (ribose-2'-O)-methylase RlmE/FtsJ
MQSGKNFIHTSKYLKNLKITHDYSKYMYTKTFDKKDVYVTDFLRVFEDLCTASLFPSSPAMRIRYDDINFENFFEDNKKVKENNVYDTKINKLKNKMIIKMKEFMEKMYKPKNESALNNQIFHNYTHYEIRDFVEEKMNAEIVTNAWIKIYDLIMGNFSIKLTPIHEMDIFRSFHMCELPGAFIAGTNHYIKTNSNMKFEWVAQSLKDKTNKNMIQDQYGMYKTHPQNYDFGATGDGNLYNQKNVEHYITKYWDTSFNLITSDCGESLDENVSMKEDQMWELHWNQFVIAVALKSDYYFSKLYSIYSTNIHKLLLIAGLFFDKVVLYRPYTTKVTSDEIYLVCSYRKKYDRTIWKTLQKLDIDSIKIPPSFMEQMYTYNKILYYRRTINVNFYLFILGNLPYIKDVNDSPRGTRAMYNVRSIYEKTRILRNYYIYAYVYGKLFLKPIKDSQKLLPVSKKKTFERYNHDFSFEVKYLDNTKKLIDKEEKSSEKITDSDDSLSLSK